jgi:broad specificity phosphatase PhoE
LGEFGLSQAAMTAERLKSVGADVLLSSHWPRAYQTAEVIAKATCLTIQEYPDLREQEISSIVHGVPEDSEINKRFLQERIQSGINLNFDWKFRGEGETMNELLMRAKNVCNTLATEYKGKKVIAVTHGVFIAVLVATMIFGYEPHKKTVIDFFKAFHHHNAGISVLDYDEESGQWSLVSLNDHSHLS